VAAWQRDAATLNAIYVSRLLSPQPPPPTPPARPTCQHSRMATAVETAPVINGVNGHAEPKANGKAKSKNQLRRQKLKQKKAVHASTPTPVRRVFFCFVRIPIEYYRRKMRT
jgi:hypothetical protein